MEWVEQRRAALERYMNRTAQHPVLRVDLDFINFLESDQVSFYFDSTQNILDSLLTFILQRNYLVLLTQLL